MAPEQTDERRHTVPERFDGMRLDACVAAMEEGLSRSAARRLIDDGHVLLDGKSVKVSTRVATAQTIDIGVPDPEPIHIKPQDIPLDIVYESDGVIVVNKPAGMPVHPGPGHPDGTLVNALAGHFDTLSHSGGAHRPGLVHRLDMQTSGLLLAASDDRIHRELSAAIERREVKRLYEVLAWDTPAQPSGRLTTRYGRDPYNRLRMSVLPEGGRRAVTDYQVVESYHWSWTPLGERARTRSACRVICGLQTGRTHQVRVHMQHLGAPLIADPDYGDPRKDTGGPDELNALVAAFDGQALHAVQIEFVHPLTGAEVRLTAPPPEPFIAARKWLRERGT
jgi:23S rRNA pseudouridine1911/1915/1917 synthase